MSYIHKFNFFLNTKKPHLVQGHIYDTIVVSCLIICHTKIGCCNYLLQIRWSNHGMTLNGRFFPRYRHGVSYECHTGVIQVSYNIQWHKQQNYWTSSPVSILPFCALSEDFFLCFFREKKSKKSTTTLCTYALPSLSWLTQFTLA